MPLVRIDLVRGRRPDEVRRLADTVQAVLEEVFAAPAHDRYQLITEHDADHVVVEDTGLGIPRTPGVTVIEITYQGVTGIRSGSSSRPWPSASTPPGSWHPPTWSSPSSRTGRRTGPSVTAARSS